MNKSPDYTHGTMVAEIIAENHNNGGITGVVSILGENITVNTINPKLTPAEIKKILIETSKQVEEKNPLYKIAKPEIKKNLKTAYVIDGEWSCSNQSIKINGR